MVSGIERAATKVSEGHIGRTSNRGVFTAIFSLLMALIAVGTIGCGSTRLPAGTTNSTASNTASENQSTSSSNNSSNASSANNQSSTSSSNSTPSAAVLVASSSSLGFGDVQVGSSTSQLVTLTNSGNSNVNILSVAASGAGFTTSTSSSVTLAPNQSENVYVNFVPAAAGSMVGAVRIASDASNSLLSISLSGSGIASQDPAHSVNLSWSPSSSSVAGYYVNRSNVSGGPYTRVSASADPNPAYTDTAVAQGTYYYVVTSVDSNNVESAYSNEVQAIVP